MTTSSAAEPAGAAMYSTPLCTQTQTEENLVNVLKTYYVLERVKKAILVRSSYPFGTIDVVSEGKEGIRADDHRLQGADPVLLFSSSQRLGHLIKHGLPNRQIWTLPTEKMHYFVTKKASSRTGGCKSNTNTH